MSNDKHIFKEGDTVYRPFSGTKIHYVKCNPQSTVKYPLIVEGRSYTSSGHYSTDYPMPELFAATVENQQALQVLYGCGFDHPPRLLTGSEVVADILDGTCDVVVAQVSNVSQRVADDDNKFVVAITSYDDEGFNECSGRGWRYAAPAIAVLIYGAEA